MRRASCMLGGAIDPEAAAPLPGTARQHRNGCGAPAARLMPPLLRRTNPAGPAHRLHQALLQATARMQARVLVCGGGCCSCCCGHQGAGLVRGLRRFATAKVRRAVALVNLVLHRASLPHRAIHPAACCRSALGAALAAGVADPAQEVHDKALLYYRRVLEEIVCQGKPAGHRCAAWLRETARPPALAGGSAAAPLGRASDGARALLPAVPCRGAGCCSRAPEPRSRWWRCSARWSPLLLTRCLRRRR